MSTSDDSDRELQICFSTAMTSSASVLSSPDVERVSVVINFSLLCDRSLHAEVTGIVAHISRSLYNSEYTSDSFFLCIYSSRLARLLQCDRSFRSQTSSAPSLFIGL